MLIIIFGIAIGVWYYTLYRGRLFIRAYAFIMMHSAGETVELANAKAKRIGFLDATDYVPLAKAFTAELYDGKQLAVIAAARKTGFQG